MGKDKISIIIPLYNKGNNIKETILSVLNQTYEDFELLIVDDGSTDNSSDIVKSINDRRIRYVYKENGGPSSARNYGVQHALYDWILFLDADDQLLPTAIEIFCEHIAKYESVDCFFANFYYSRDKKLKLYSGHYKSGFIKNNFKSFALRKCMPRTGTAVFKKTVLQACPFKEYLRRYEDFEQFFRIFSRFVFFRIDEPVFMYVTDACEAKYKRNDISEDYLGYLKLTPGISWKNIVIYHMYILARQDYPKESKALYPHFKNKLLLWFLVRLVTNKYIDRLYYYF